MSPEKRLSRGARQRIREIKRDIRSKIDLTAAADNTWPEMADQLRIKIPNSSQLPWPLIHDWFETRIKIRRLPTNEQREEITAFQSRYSKEEIVAAKDALAIITQTLTK